MTGKLKLRKERIAELLMRPYNQRIMNNVHRSEFVECLVAIALEDTWDRQEHWSEHDFEHTESGKRLELKQSAALQTWTGEDYKPFHGEFKIKPPGSTDVYLYAWHEENDSDRADQSDCMQWKFFILPAEKLPDQDSIRPNSLSKITPRSCTIDELSERLSSLVKQL